MEKTLTIDGQEVRFRASAAIPRLYRIKFGRDLIQDMASIKKELDKQADPTLSTIPVKTLTLFENVAYIMAKHGNPDGVPNTAEEWLDSFDTFSVYAVFPAIMELWSANMTQINEPQKK